MQEHDSICSFQGQGLPSREKSNISTHTTLLYCKDLQDPCTVHLEFYIQYIFAHTHNDSEAMLSCPSVWPGSLWRHYRMLEYVILTTWIVGGIIPSCILIDPVIWRALTPVLEALHLWPYHPRHMLMQSVNVATRSKSLQQDDGKCRKQTAYD